MQRSGTGKSRFRRARLLDRDDGQPTGSVLLNQPLLVEAELDVGATIEEAILEVGICLR